jgi:two-component system sensor histidine kinase KdpD
VGIGLAIARGFSEAMNTTIGPLETPGGGLTMRVMVPVAS